MTARIVVPEIPDESALAAFEAARGTKPFGPFEPLLHAPALLPKVEALGRAVRFDGTLPDDVREVAILTTAHVWNQQVEWEIHAPVARAAGVAEATLAAIATNQPVQAPDAQRVAITVARALHRTRDLDDLVFAEAHSVFGTEGLIELSVLCGYYALLAMVMNTARTAH